MDIELDLDEYVSTLEDENKGLRWILAVLLERMGNTVTVTPIELAEVDWDDTMEMEQNEDKTWTISRPRTYTVEPVVTHEEGAEA